MCPHPKAPPRPGFGLHFPDPSTPTRSLAAGDPRLRTDPYRSSVPMHPRQSGAAHAPIMPFIVVMVMFLGAVGWAYSVTNTNAELTKKVAGFEVDNKNLTGKVHLFEHYAEALGRVIDLPGKYEGRAEVAK